ncbi:MAG: hypothetical protein KatS3mg115_0667 [Candidatus Poribacteria bacterium]|nr:MAG: hypothetical protein KatS3mg115_0667 [Candidatus Poribacteria bacterium]
MLRIKSRWLAFAAVGLLLGGAAWAQIVVDFEDGDTSNWMFVDEKPENLGDVGPSAWEIRESQLGLDGMALYQGSNIWGGPADEQLLGTFAIYTGQTFTDFTLEIDVAAADNDGMGLVWGYTDTSSHNRVIMINDGWPDVPLDGHKGPMVIAHNRISDDSPWYGDPLAFAHPPEYVPYPEDGSRQHWTLTVENGHFTFTTDFGTSLEGDAPVLEGYVGIQLYAMQAEFDNLTILPLGVTAVDPAGKAAVLWGALKSD